MSQLKQNVAIIIVNYNAGNLLASNLKKILESVGDDLLLHIFIVDNLSTDNSVDVLNDMIISLNASDRISLIISDINGGFAYGNNIGIKTALCSNFKADFFYFLNPDAVPQVYAINKLVSESLKYDNNCILGSQMLNQDGSKAASAFRFPSIVSEFSRGSQLGFVCRLFKNSTLVIPTDEILTPCDWVCGAGFILPIEVFEKLGFMDERYFLYYEEVDYMKQAKNLNVFVAVINTSIVVHIAGVSTGIVGGNAQSIPDYWYNSWNHYFYKNHHMLVALMSGIAWTIGRIFNNLVSFFITSRRKIDGHSIFKFIKKSIMPIGGKK